MADSKTYHFPAYEQEPEITIGIGYDSYVLKNGKIKLDPDNSNHQQFIQAHGGKPDNSKRSKI